MRICEVETDNQPLRSGLAGQPLQSFARTAARIQDTHAWLDAEACNGTPKLRFCEGAEQPQFARVIARGRIVEQSSGAARHH
jgi:hypothetical protein